jgi:hypothetical protein
MIVIVAFRRLGATQRDQYRELGKLPRTARYGPILQLGGYRHRPWLSGMTARNRWLGHVGGTAGEDEAGLRRGSDGHQLDRRARSVLGDRLPRWQVAGGDAAGLLRAPGRSEPDNHDEPSEAEESPEGEEHNADEAVLPGHNQHGPHVDDQARAEHGMRVQKPRGVRAGRVIA